MYHSVWIRGSYQSDIARFGAVAAVVRDGLWDIPASGREAAFASGDVATLNGVAGDHRVETAKTFGAFPFGDSTPTTISLLVSARRG